MAHNLLQVCNKWRDIRDKNEKSGQSGVASEYNKKWLPDWIRNTEFFPTNFKLFNSALILVQGWVACSWRQFQLWSLFNECISSIFLFLKKPCEHLAHHEAMTDL